MSKVTDSGRFKVAAHPDLKPGEFVIVSTDGVQTGYANMKDPETLAVTLLETMNAVSSGARHTLAAVVVSESWQEPLILALCAVRQ